MMPTRMAECGGDAQFRYQQGPDRRNVIPLNDSDPL